VAAWPEIALLVAVILAGAGARIASRSRLKTRIVLLYTVGVLSFFVVVAGLILFSSFYGLVLSVMLLAAVTRYQVVSRQVRTTAIVSTISASLRQNLPLPTALREAVGSLPGNCDRIVEDIASGLEEGLPLSQALERAYPRCPGHVLGLVRMAERVDQLPQAFAALEDDLIVQIRRFNSFRPVNAWYPLIVFVVGLFVITGVMYFVVPKFSKLYADFPLIMPDSTAFLVRLCGKYLSWIWVAPVAIVLVWLFLRLRGWFRPRRVGRLRRFDMWGDWVKWHLPVLHWFEENSGRGRLADSLCLSLRAGCTMNEAVDQALELDVNEQFRRRVVCWRHAVDQGEDPGGSARRCRLGRPLAWAFDATVNPGNTLAVLEMLSSVYRSNYGYRANLARYIFWPCTIVAMGVGVGFVAYAFFVPIVAMIYGTMDVTMP
jgi:type II secretory pathway component PulF